MASNMLVISFRSTATAQCYLISGSAGGRGSDAFVKITKSRAYFDSAMAHYNEKQQERLRLQALFSCASTNSAMINQTFDNRENTIGGPLSEVAQTIPVDVGLRIQTSISPSASYHQSLINNYNSTSVIEALCGRKRLVGDGGNASKALRPIIDKAVEEIIDLT